MLQLSDDQYFLIIPDINLFPEINKNTIAMIEQIMNALLLSSKDNIQAGINKVVMFEIHCKPLLYQDYINVLNRIKPMLEAYNISIAQGEEVKSKYPRYHKCKYYWEVGKQAAINLEFSLEKKLSYDGNEIKWESTYIDWVNQIINHQRENSSYNSQDKLLYHFIEPQATLKHVETREIILEETKKYTEEYRKYLKLQKKSIQ